MVIIKAKKQLSIVLNDVMAYNRSPVPVVIDSGRQFEVESYGENWLLKIDGRTAMIPKNSPEWDQFGVSTAEDESRNLRASFEKVNSHRQCQIHAPILENGDDTPNTISNSPKPRRRSARARWHEISGDIANGNSPF